MPLALIRETVGDRISGPHDHKAIKREFDLADRAHHDVLL
jgi:hypothetical protein